MKLSQDVRHEDSGRLQPDVLLGGAGRGDELPRDVVGVGRVLDFVERRPESAAGVERIEDDVAPLRPVVVGDKLAAGVVDDGGVAARLDRVEHLTQGCGLARAGRTDERQVSSFQVCGQGNARQVQSLRSGALARQAGQGLLFDDARATASIVLRSVSTPPAGEMGP